MSAGNTAAQMAERELTIERVFNAPRPLVFKAWTESEHMSQWFGSRGFKSTVLKNELHPGGAYRIHMLGPDGDLLEEIGGAWASVGVGVSGALIEPVGHVDAAVRA